MLPFGMLAPTGCSTMPLDISGQLCAIHRIAAALERLK
jgi:hypothetical protein